MTTERTTSESNSYKSECPTIMPEVVPLELVIMDQLEGWTSEEPVYLQIERMQAYAGEYKEFCPKAAEVYFELEF